MLLLDGCVQPAMSPNINAATARVFDKLGVQLVVAREAGCCGAIRFHNGDHPGGSTICAPTSTHGGRISRPAPKRSS
jgi:heterodisulfide reductase subunit B